MVFGGKFRIRRCNSKASYLPRQSLEKLSNSDPDHGSYKLTLTSNEDLVAPHGNKPPPYEILTHGAKVANNLPDVLPMGAKLQPQPSSPTASIISPLRYSSNNNLALKQPSQQSPSSSASCYPMYPTQHRYSSPSMSGCGNSQVPNYTRSQSFEVNQKGSGNSTATSPTKYMSQSTIDLKRMHQLEPTLEETTSLPYCETSSQVLSPSQSEQNISSHRSTEECGTAETTATHRERTTTEGRIFRAELVNTTLSTSPSGMVASCSNNHKSVTRKDSLRENIEKITQLQSQLMSAHLNDSVNILGGYGSKPAALSPPTAKQMSNAADETELRLQQRENVCQLKAQEEQKKEDQSHSSNIVAATEMGCNAAECMDSKLTCSLQMETTALAEPNTTTTQPTCNNSVESAAAQSDNIRSFAQLDAGVDGLKLMQRSELVLRVNPSTTDAASQTDDLPDGDIKRLTVQHAKDDAQIRTTLQPRQRHPIEIECEIMSKELANLLSSNDKLFGILTPQMTKSAADYVSNLYNPDVPLRPSKRDVGTSTLMRMKTRGDALDMAESCSNIVTVELQYADVEVALMDGNDETESCDLLKKKVDELMKLLNRKLHILGNEQSTLGEESTINDELGNVLIGKLAVKVRPIETTKCRAYIDDVGHITSLLLSLSERLARVENSLGTIGDNNSIEKKTLEIKRARLLDQLDEAKRLKADIERRGTYVLRTLENNLSADEFADFDYFINMKAKLIADTRDIADKIKSGEEQLCALCEALIQSDC